MKNGMTAVSPKYSHRGIGADFGADLHVHDVSILGEHVFGPGSRNGKLLWHLRNIDFSASALTLAVAQQKATSRHWSIA